MNSELEQYSWLRFDECNCPVIDREQFKALMGTNPDEAERQMFQALADYPEARAAMHEVMGMLGTGIDVLIVITIVSLGIAAYCWATRK